MSDDKFTYKIAAGFQKAEFVDLSTLKGVSIYSPAADERIGIKLDDLKMEWVLKAVPMWWQVDITVAAAPDGDLTAMRRVTFRFGSAYELEGQIDPTKAKLDLTAELNRVFQEAWQEWKGDQ